MSRVISRFNFASLRPSAGVLSIGLSLFLACAAIMVNTQTASASSNPIATVLSDAVVSTANGCTSGTPLAVRGVVFDQSGNAFIADTGTAGSGTCSGGSDNGGIWEVPYSGSNTWGTPQEVIQFSSGNQPNGLAINTSGDLFVADNGNNTVYEFAKQGTTAQGYSQFLDPTCSAATAAPDTSCFAQTTIATTGSGLIGLAIAPDGSLYFADQSTHAIEHATSSSGTWTLTSTGITISGDTYAGIAVSSTGNLFYDDYNTGSVYESTPNGGGGFNTPITLATTTSNGANYLAVDSYGNVFFVNSAASSLYEIPLGSSGSYSTPTVLVTGLASYAVGMGLDSLDNFYVQDSNYDFVEYGTPLQNQSSSTLSVTSSPPPTSSSGPGGTYIISATPGSGTGTSSDTSVTVSIDPTTTANCSASNYTVTFLASGNCIVDITRGGDGTYAPYRISQTFIIGNYASTTFRPGYYIAANDGGVFTYGSANFYGSLSNTHLNKPIVGITSTPDAKGYWLVASDGGVFSFGDATFYGSTGNMTLNKPIVGITATPDGKGYWLVASDGGVFSFGDATFLGSAANLNLNQPVVSIKSVVLA